MERRSRKTGATKKMRTKLLITVICLIAIGGHLTWPAFKIDLITLILVIVAVLPWTASLIKSLELPGGFKIELQDVKAATDKVTSLPILPSAERGNLSVSTIDSGLSSRPINSISNLQETFGKDSNLALVGVRIEIEKRLNLLAERNHVDIINRPIRYKLQRLQQLQVIPPEVASGLNDLVTMGNKAAHGAEVAPEVSAWVLDSGPLVISILDEIINAENSWKSPN